MRNLFFALSIALLSVMFMVLFFYLCAWIETNYPKLFRSENDAALEILFRASIIWFIILIVAMVYDFLVGF